MLSIYNTLVSTIRENIPPIQASLVALASFCPSRRSNSPPLPRVRLPRELLLEIFSLARGNRKDLSIRESLSSFTLVSRDWSEPAKFLLLKSLDVAKNTELDRVVGLLESYPRATRSLVLVGPSNGVLEEGLHDPAPLLTHLGVPNDKANEIVDKCRSLQDLEFVGYDNVEQLLGALGTRREWLLAFRGTKPLTPLFFNSPSKTLTQRFQYLSFDTAATLDDQGSLDSF